jgi:predicted Rossmann fold flavoprotein
MSEPPVSSSQNVADVAVIGAGGAGLLAGIAAASAGARTLLYERNKAPAKKVSISGGGRCNYTNTLDPRSFVKLFGDKNSAQLGHALRAFSNQQVIDLLKNHGVEGQVERNYRLYTKSGRGGDVVEALVKEFQSHGGTLLLNSRILSFTRLPDGLFELVLHRTGHEEVRRAKTVVIATGGLSYPVTGSTGDGYDWARTAGHTVTRLRAALVGLTVEEAWTKTLQGLAWEDAQISLYPFPPGGNRASPQGKPLGSERAEFLFTHFGISGPAILDISNVFVNHGLTRGLLLLDFFPDQKREELEALLQERFRQFPNRVATRALDGLLPNRLMEFFEAQLGADGAVSACRFPKTARAKLLDLFKRLPLTVTGTRDMCYGEVTAGGVEWDEIDPRTMESRRMPGLFFAGEVLDVAGRCGGFNLQAAFSTGYLAGREAACKASGAASGSTTA